MPPPFPALDPHAAWLASVARCAHVAVGVSRMDDGRFLEVNDAFCRLFRLTREAVIGRTSAALGLWPDRAQRERLLAQIRLHGSVSGFPARYRNQAGEEGQLLVSARIVDGDGTPCLVGFLTEVSDQHELLEGLRTAQGRLGVALRATELLVFAQDRALRYTWAANPALGATEAEVLGRTDAELLGPEVAAPLTAIKQRVLDTGRAERRDVWVANNGQLACFDLVVEPERDAAGRVQGIVCAAMDITQRVTAGGASWPPAPVPAPLPAPLPGPPAAPAPLPATGYAPAALPEAGAESPPARPTAPPVPAGPLLAIEGLAALIGREDLSPRQAERLRRILRELHRLGRPDRPDLAAARIGLRRRHGGRLVVVAEHNPVLRELVAALLEEAGLRVMTAATGVQAFSLAVQHRPALLLLDMALPQRGGVAAARAVRATTGQGALPIIAMLAPGRAAEAGRALDADLDDLIDKPVSAEALYRKVLAWLEPR